MGWTHVAAKMNIMAAGRRQNRVSHEALGFSLEGCDYGASSRLYVEFPGLWTQLDQVCRTSVLISPIRVSIQHLAGHTVKVLPPLHLPCRIEEGLPVPYNVASR